MAGTVGDWVTGCDGDDDDEDGGVLPFAGRSAKKEKERTKETVRMNGVEGRKEYNDELTLFNLSERRVQEGEEDKGKGNHIGYISPS